MKKRSKQAIQYLAGEIWRGIRFASEGIRWLVYPSSDELRTETERLELQLRNTKLRNKLNRQKSELLFGRPSRPKRNRKHKEQKDLYSKSTVP